ncbi:MAG: hypothetical protein QOD77_950 [Thermoplasmata archaeon]|jgi:Raf kinase inhibitor-like YbhB/YbcL family protein|nr:hypothetical protein [Thermoplasmata archaeon]
MRNLALLTACAVLLAGCGGAPGLAGTTSSGTMATTQDPALLRLSSPDFADGAPMPRAYSCDANQQRQVSPPLNVTGVAPATLSLALILQDADMPVPEAPASTLTLWLVWNLTAPDGALRFPQGGLPHGAIESEGYRGPCPAPASAPHHYNFTVYALDVAVTLEPGSDREALEAAMAGHVLATARLVGTYARQVV